MNGLVHYRLVEGLFDRWYIQHPTDDRLAWSGSRWVPSGGAVQVCNFLSQEAAREHAKKYCAPVAINFGKGETDG